MQAAAVAWCREVAGRRACRPLDGAAPAAVFAAVEAEALQPLPGKPFVLATWSTATVGPDIHAKVGKTLYSVPWRLIGQRVDARATCDAWCRSSTTDSWSPPTAASRQGKQTDFGALPAGEDRVPDADPDLVPHAGPPRSARPAPQVIAGLLEVNALFRLRAAQGVLGLADKHGPARLEAACAKAIAVGDPSYRTIKGILAAGAGDRPAATGRPATAAPRRTCTALRSCSRTSSPCPPRTRATATGHHERRARQPATTMPTAGGLMTAAQRPLPDPAPAGGTTPGSPSA